jgi:NAD(P)H-flavin reductase
MYRLLPTPLITASPIANHNSKFLPGQWLDVHVPGVEKAGGFTITTPPRYATSTSMNPNYRPYVELAVQKSPDNPAAAWLWQPVKEIQGKELAVRVGGSFVWPPPGIDTNDIKRIVLIAGGVGIK